MEETIEVIVVLGSGGVGKSAITYQYIQKIYIGQYDLTLEDTFRKVIETEGEKRILEILDTQHNRDFSLPRDQNIKRGQKFIIVYSVTDQESFESCSEFLETILKVKDCDTVPLVLVGNKIDLEKERKITFQQGVSLAQKFNCSFFETSALIRINIDQVFNDIINQVAPQSKLQNNIQKKKGCILM